MIHGSKEVAINYTPCGYERQRRLPNTCHRVLDRFLPEGYSLTVYGTDQNNQPFRHTYRGRGT
ncbi:DddA-like double-stranded DNA deaminase toxin [Saccharopolyspora phatthalungensis]|uniref:DddA-like double-stranded DNA deaminase toxin n=1 Tax=Saccharopolyspora phatthalungensis TaxID=664693 RepID=UPI001618B878